MSVSSTYSGNETVSVMDVAKGVYFWFNHAGDVWLMVGDTDYYNKPAKEAVQLSTGDYGIFVDEEVAVYEYGDKITVVV